MSIPCGEKPTEREEWVALLYHELRPITADYSYVLPCSRFEEHLSLFDSLPASSYRPIITFDDGHISNYTYALPALERVAMKAHFFITAGWMSTRPDYMSSRHLRALHEAGHTIGAHGWSHALLTRCTAVELRRELDDARAALEQAISAPVTTISLPGGRGDARVIHACQDAGYTTVWTSAPGAIKTVSQPVVGRFNILNGHTDPFLCKLLDPASGQLARAARMNSYKALAQRVIGDRAYATVWALLNRKEGAADDASAQQITPESGSRDALP